MEGGEQEAGAGGGTDRQSSSELSEQLLRACEDGDLNKVKYLVEVGHVDPHSCRDEHDHNTALHWAAGYGHLDIVKYLVEERNCDVECRNKYEGTPLILAAYEGRLEIMQYLISERGCDPMCRGQVGRTPLHAACQNSRLDVVKYLMENVKVDSSCRDDDTSATPLHLAAQYGTLDVVQYLIGEQQSDAECRDKHENTPLHLAALCGKLATVQYLISERGCDPMCRGQGGRTPLHAACQTGRLDVVNYLIENVKIDSSCGDVNDLTPIHVAALCGQLSVVKLLVEDYLCDPGVRNKDGWTLSDVAGIKGHTHITSYLSSIEKIVSTDLRRALVAQLKPYTRKATPNGKVLGSGTYGSVIEMTSARETVAGKVFRMSSTAQMLPVAFRVCGELSTMMQLHHPNIVQCKGVSLLTDQPFPVLLMERLMSSLHDYLLHPYNSNLSVERKVSILHDTASGLDYLHSQTPAIIHRDLTAKNVLLDSQLRAKIADFGNSRIMDLDPEATPETLTSLPGTLEYMPPEAQGGSVTYDPSLDVFSFGHLSLFTVTQTPVRPLLPPNYSDSNGKLLGRSEVKRRARFVEAAEQVLSENHSLVSVLKQCLHNNPAQRPHTAELVTRLQGMVTPGSAASTPADTHSPSHGRGPVEADSETDNSPTEKNSSATGGHTDSRLCIIAICVAVAVIGVLMGIFGAPAISLLHDVTPRTIQTSTTMPPGIHAGNDTNLKWMNQEPDIRLLTLIKYTNPEGKEDRFYLTRTLQNDCKHLGTFLGIDKETLTAYSEKSKPKSEVCEDILYEWMKRSEGDYDVTWAGLLEAMDDAGLGGVANQLIRALNMHFK